jgi:hypothetical protein
MSTVSSAVLCDDTMRTTDMSAAVPARREWGRHHPGYSVNAQRIDLAVS